nr:hypothetical protein I308_02822 [Cryptococcus tetragattii IND107]
MAHVRSVLLVSAWACLPWGGVGVTHEAGGGIGLP